MFVGVSPLIFWHLCVLVLFRFLASWILKGKTALARRRHVWHWQHSELISKTGKNMNLFHINQGTLISKVLVEERLQSYATNRQREHFGKEARCRCNISCCKFYLIFRCRSLDSYGREVQFYLAGHICCCALLGDGFPRRSLASSSRILFMASVAPLDFAFHSVGPRHLGIGRIGGGRWDEEGKGRSLITL